MAIEKGSIDALTAVLEQLGDLGSVEGTVLDELWFGKDCEGRSNNIDGRAYEEGMALLQRMKKARSLMDVLTASLDRKIDSYKTNVMPLVLHHGLETLPNELLLAVLKKFRRPDRDVVFDHFMVGLRLEFPVKQLQLVCRRFRSVVRSCADFWSLVIYRSGVPEETFRRRLSLHSAGPIDLVVKLDKEDYNFSRIIKPWEDRLRTLFLVGGDEEDIDFEIDDPAGDSLSEMDLASVRRLLIYRAKFTNDIYSAWNFENLTDLQTSDMPLPGYCPYLTNLTVTLNSGTDFFNFMNFLRTTPQLKCLSMDIDNADTEIYDGEALKEVKLQELHTLELDFSILKMNNIAPYGVFLNELVMPALDALKIVIRPPSADVYESSWFSLLFPSRQHSSLKTLSVSLFTNNFTNRQFRWPLADIFKRFPGIQSLTISPGHLDPYGSWDGVPEDCCANLRSLRFDFCGIDIFEECRKLLFLFQNDSVKLERLELRDTLDVRDELREIQEDKYPACKLVIL